MLLRYRGLDPSNIFIKGYKTVAVGSLASVGVGASLTVESKSSNADCRVRDPESTRHFCLPSIACASACLILCGGFKLGKKSKC